MQYESIVKKDKVLNFFLYTGPFDKGIRALKQNGLELITSRDLAEVRISSDIGSVANSTWTWVAESFNYFADGRIVVADKKNNLILKSPKFATNISSKGRYFFLKTEETNNLLEISSKDPIEAQKSGAFMFEAKEETLYIPTKRLHEEPLTLFLFRDVTKEYGSFLNEHGINHLPIYFVLDKSIKSSVFARELLLERIVQESTISGDFYIDLHLESGRVSALKIKRLKPARQKA
ncbi:MAG: hypothetical protein QXN46_02465, partial [Candidatus Woesearchaeota archaeon]